MRVFGGEPKRQQQYCLFRYSSHGRRLLSHCLEPLTAIYNTTSSIIILSKHYSMFAHGAVNRMLWYCSCMHSWRKYYWMLTIIIVRKITSTMQVNCDFKRYFHLISGSLLFPSSSSLARKGLLHQSRVACLLWSHALCFILPIVVFVTSSSFWVRLLLPFIRGLFSPGWKNRRQNIKHIFSYSKASVSLLETIDFKLYPFRHVIHEMNSRTCHY